MEVAGQRITVLHVDADETFGTAITDHLERRRDDSAFDVVTVSEPSAALDTH